MVSRINRLSARAIATLTKPGRDADRQRREQDETDSAQRFRERERWAARELWTEAAPIAGTPGEAYLPLGARLRFHANAPL